MLKKILAAIFLILLLADVALFARAETLQASSYPWPGGHDAAGVTSPSDKWYFAEGCTREGFDC
ncbi:MAG: hypothetical protein JW854_12075, partial [Actinobacteria bacterium]|nr:hypothetical protein [Actinomycetota bacterium]